MADGILINNGEAIIELTGTATPEDVRAGKTFYSTDAKTKLMGTGSNIEDLSSFTVLSASSAATWWGGTSGTSTKTWSYTPTQDYKIVMFIQSMNTDYGANTGWVIKHTNLNHDGITYYKSVAYSNWGTLCQAITIFFNVKANTQLSLSSSYNGDRWQGTASMQAIYGIN